MFLPDKMYKNKSGELHYVLYHFPESIYPIIALDSRKRFQKFKKDGRFYYPLDVHLFLSLFMELNSLQ